MKHIQWFPGHMTKAMRMMEECVSLVDGVLVVLDARAPAATFNKKLRDLFAAKPVLYILNKADLADGKRTDAFCAEIAKSGALALKIAATSPSAAKQTGAKIAELLKDKREKDAAKGVSFRLSNYAIIKAVNWTDKTVPMIRIGVESETADAESGIHDARNTYISGGVIDASGVASGISVDGGWDITLSNITITGSYYGLHIKYAPNKLGATCADVENVNVVGNGETGSVGILLEGTQNTLTNMKVSDVQYALKCTETGSDNVLRSIMAIGTGLTGTDNAGFWDMSAGNQYDICYSDQYATGFLMEERTCSVYNGCRVSWWSADNDYHVGFRAVGKFNSTVLYSKVYHNHTVKTDAYLLVGADGGEGTVQYPIRQIVSAEYDSVLAKYCSTDILN